MKRIGLLTSGGDGPGINACIRAVVKEAYDSKEGNSVDYEVIGFENGWKGIIQNETREFPSGKTSGLLPSGGSTLGSSRRNPFKKEKRLRKLKKNFELHSLEGLIAIGGDDTQTTASRLYKEEGLPVIGIPQTIDNDVAETIYSIGFRTTVDTVMKSLDQLHSTAYSHHRVLILEVMGRKAGYIALMGGLAGGADVISVPEEEFDIEYMKRRIKEREVKEKHFSIVVVSEGVEDRIEEMQELEEEKDEFGHERLGGIGAYLENKLGNILDMTVRYTRLAYLQRGGEPNSFDRNLATICGVKAVKLCREKKFGVMIALRGEGDILKVEPVSLEKVTENSPRNLEQISRDFWYLKELFY